MKRVHTSLPLAIFLITSVATLLFGASRAFVAHAESAPTATSTTLDLTATPTTAGLTAPAPSSTPTTAGLTTPAPSSTPTYLDQTHATDGIIALAILLVVIIILGILVGRHTVRKKNPTRKRNDNNT